MGYTIKKEEDKVELAVKEKKVSSTKKISKKIDEKPAAKVGYFKQIKNELAKVKWPEAKNVIKYSLATLIFCVFLGAFFEGLNALSSLIKGLFS